MRTWGMFMAWWGQRKIKLRDKGKASWGGRRQDLNKNMRLTFRQESNFFLGISVYRFGDRKLEFYLHSEQTGKYRRVVRTTEWKIWGKSGESSLIAMGWMSTAKSTLKCNCSVMRLEREAFKKCQGHEDISITAGFRSLSRELFIDRSLDLL